MKDIVSEEKYSQMLELQKRLNLELQELFEANKDQGREHLSKLLVNAVESMVEKINSEGYNFGCSSYGGDINYENSEQSYSDGKEMGTGVTLNFVGFSVQVTWQGTDRYTKI